jgi:predicted  nucleic acid-binding Zn-ribbon protein
VKARPEDQLALLTLQDRDNHITQLNHARKNIAEQAELAEVTASLREFSQSLIAAQGVLEDAKIELSRIEDDVRVVDERIAKDKERESGAASAKDLQALEAELTSLATRKSNLEDIELVVMQSIEDAEVAVADVVVERDAVEARRASLAAAVASREAEIDAELVKEQAARTELAASLPADLVELYERQRARYGIGAALLTRRVTGGSGVELTSTDLDAVRAAAPDDVVICPDSSCILVRTNESGL